MANQMYPLGRQAFGEAALDWTGQDWRVALVDDTYVYDPTDQFLADISGVIAHSGNLTGKSNVQGVCDAADVTFPTVGSGPTVGGIVLYQWTGDAATSRVVIFYDSTTAAQAIDFPTDGGDVVVRWSNGNTRMFRI